MKPKFVKDNNKKTKKSDPYNKIRRELPRRAAYLIPSDRDKGNKKNIIYCELQEWQDEIDNLGVKF